MGVEVHLHLPELVVSDNDDGVVAKGIGFHHLANALVVGAHTTANERFGARGDIVATFKSSVTFYLEDRLQTEMLIAQADDSCLRSTLAGVHSANNVATRSGDALVAGEVEVHQRVLYIPCLIACVVVRLR